MALSAVRVWFAAASRRGPPPKRGEGKLAIGDTVETCSSKSINTFFTIPILLVNFFEILLNDAVSENLISDLFFLVIIIAVEIFASSKILFDGLSRSGNASIERIV